MLNKEFKKLWTDYIEDYIIVLDEQGNYDDPRDIIGSNELIETITSDLEDKGFTKEDCNAIVNNFDGLDHQIIYKLIAYLLWLFDEYTSIEELKAVINEHYDTDIDNYTDEDLEEIIKARNKLDV